MFREGEDRDYASEDDDHDRDNSYSPEPYQVSDLLDEIYIAICKDPDFDVKKFNTCDKLVEFITGINVPPHYTEWKNELISAINFHDDIDFDKLNDIDQFMTKLADLLTGINLDPNTIITPEDVYNLCTPRVADLLQTAVEKHKQMTNNGSSARHIRETMVTFTNDIYDTMTTQNDGWLDQMRTIKLNFSTALKIDQILFGIGDAGHWLVPYAKINVVEHGLFVCKL